MDQTAKVGIEEVLLYLGRNQFLQRNVKDHHMGIILMQQLERYS